MNFQTPNFSPVCYALFKENKRLALSLLHKLLQEFAGDSSDIYLYLTVLNSAFYYYLFSYYYTSLDACYEKCNTNISKKKCTLNIYSDSEKILLTYFDCLKNRGGNTKNEYVEHAIHYINDNFSEHITLCDVANHIRLSKNHFQNLFKTEMKLTVGQFITLQQIQKAKELLLTTRLSLEHISQDCGFNSASYFSTIFKKTCGITPNKYRNFPTSSEE